MLDLDFSVDDLLYKKSGSRPRVVQYSNRCEKEDDHAQNQYRAAELSGPKGPPYDQ